MAGECFDADATGVTKAYKSGIADYQVHLRGGQIIPIQDAYTNKVRNVKGLESVPMRLGVLPNKDLTFRQIDSCGGMSHAAG